MATHFDGEATTAGERRRRRDREPTSEELKAVRKVLASRDRTLHDNVDSINALLGIGGLFAPNGTFEFSPPTPGTAGHAELVERTQAVSEDLLAIRSGLREVDVNSRDKRNLMAALKESADAWKWRA